MLTTKQRKFLRAQAHPLNAILQVGKLGVSPALLEQVSLALEANELIKISILQNCDQDRHEVAEQLATGTGADLVQLIGKVVVLYRTSINHSRLALP